MYLNIHPLLKVTYTFSLEAIIKMKKEKRNIKLKKLIKIKIKNKLKLKLSDDLFLANVPKFCLFS